MLTLIQLSKNIYEIICTLKILAYICPHQYKGNQKQKQMNHFKFDHESSIIPALLTIEVSYNPYYREATYDSPAEFDADDVSYRVLCDKLDMTDCIDNSNYRELQTEIAFAVDTEISNHFFNL